MGRDTAVCEKAMRPMFEYNVGYTIGKVYRSKHFGGCLSDRVRKQDLISLLACLDRNTTIS